MHPIFLRLARIRGDPLTNPRSSLMAVCFTFGDLVPGVFTFVAAKHTKHLSLVDVLSIRVESDPAAF